MRLKNLWEVHGPGGRFDDDGNFVPTEKFGIIASLFLNFVVLPVVSIYFAFLLLLEFLPRNITSLLQRPHRNRVHF